MTLATGTRTPGADPGCGHAYAAGIPARGAGSRCDNCVACPGAEDDGSAVVGVGDGGSGVGVGSTEVCVGSGSPTVGAGGTAPPPPPLPGCDVPLAVGSAPFDPPPPLDADAEGGAEDPPAPDPAGFGDPPLAAAPRRPASAPPLVAEPPSGAAPPCRPTGGVCDGAPASSPTLMQPVAAARAMTVAARRTGT
ncbi:hypothetical protein ACWEWG_35930 [Streptomyces sp. NPDC003758]